MSVLEHRAMPDIAAPLQVDPWRVVELSFDDAHSLVSESVFSLANGRMGSRGTFEEGYSGSSTEGNYFAGVYETAPIHPSWWIQKGFPEGHDFIVNAMRWMGVAPSLDGERFDMAGSSLGGYRRTLNMRKGLLSRELIWIDSKGRKLKLRFERFISMADRHICGVRLVAEAMNFSGRLAIDADLDSSIRHYGRNRCFWRPIQSRAAEGVGALHVATENTNLEAAGAMALLLEGELLLPARAKADDLKVVLSYELELKQGVPVTIDKLVGSATTLDGVGKRGALADHARASVEKAVPYGYDALREDHIRRWGTLWKESDVVIEGDPAAQQGVRYCIFQLHQSYGGNNSALNIGAKSLSGEGHCGWTFWDTEIYCIPFYLMVNPKAARSLILYRYRTLDHARKAAKIMGYRGAKFPFCTIRGTECSGIWEDALAQVHINADVAYSVWHYYRVTGDKDFLFEYGLEILIETSRFWVCRSHWNERRGAYSIAVVTGPDEYRIAVNNNAYTNSMAGLNMKVAVEVLELMKSETPKNFEELAQYLALENWEVEKWRHMSENMYVPSCEELGIILQDDSFLDTEHAIRRDISPKELRLDVHWFMEKYIRYDLIKQADVLLLLFLRPELANLQLVRRNYEYYEPKTLHDSSLSPCVHSIMASRLGLSRQAFDYYLYTARMDLENRNNDGHLGLHTACLARAWMCITYGFAGMETIGARLKFAPVLPEEWKSYSLRFVYRDSLLELKVDKDGVTLDRLRGPAHTVQIYERDYSTESRARARPRKGLEKG